MALSLCALATGCSNCGDASLCGSGATITIDPASVAGASSLELCVEAQCTTIDVKDLSSAEQINYGSDGVRTTAVPGGYLMTPASPGWSVQASRMTTALPAANVTVDVRVLPDGARQTVRLSPTRKAKCGRTCGRYTLTFDATGLKLQSVP